MQKYIVIAVIMFLVQSCVSYAPDTVGRAEHVYNAYVTDMDGRPIQGVRVDYKVYDARYPLVDSKSYITGPDGLIVAKTNAIQSGIYTNSVLEYTLSKPGYYEKSGKLDMRQKYRPNEVITSEARIVLEAPTDYFNKDILKEMDRSQVIKEFSEHVLAIIEPLKVVAGAATARILPRSIGFSSFKGKKYMTIALVSGFEYNTNKLDIYDVGKLLFDSLIRKLLTPLNSEMPDLKKLYGYDISVTTSRRDFFRKPTYPEFTTPTGEPVTYRYLLPMESVERYKNKDITGQDLIDSSYILMNDERIGVRLQ